MILQDLSFPTLDTLQTPVWIYCVRDHKIMWANKAGLRLWEADNLEELKSRDFSLDTSKAVDAVLGTYIEELAEGDDRTLTRWWQLTPRGMRKKVLCTFSLYQHTPESPINLFIEGFHKPGISVADMDQHALACSTFNPYSFELVSTNNVFTNHFSHKIEYLSDIFVHQYDIEVVKAHSIKQESFSIDALLNTLDGYIWYHLDLGFQNVSDDHSLIVSLQNIDERKRKELEHRQKAQTDSLTGLGNRIALEKAFDDYRIEEFSVSLLFMDLDGFKTVNDTYGHGKGDQLLIQVAERLKEQVGNVVYRVGGDEFVVILTADLCVDDEQIATTIVQEVSKPYHLSDGIDAHISTSIGISRCQSLRDANLSELLRKADMAMYQAKKAGRRQAIRYSEKLGDAYQEKLRLAQLLPEAIENEELYLEFMPILNKQNNDVLLIETNIGWRMKDGSEVNKGKIIELAERVGLVESIDEWMLDKICHSYPSLSKFYQKPVVCSLALSGKYLLSNSFLPTIQTKLQCHGLDADNIAFQFTESSLLFEGKPRIDKLIEFSQAGFHILMDGFGAGLTVLPYLHQLPVQFIKLDKVYSRQLTESKQTLKALNVVTKSLGVNLILSDIDTPEQEEVLSKLGVDWYQGKIASQKASEHYSEPNSDS